MTSLDLSAAGEALRPLADTLAVDGYLLTVSSGHGSSDLRLEVRAGPDACADCLVPKETFAAIATDRLDAAGLAATVEVRYPTEHQEQADAPQPGQAST